MAIVLRQPSSPAVEDTRRLVRVVAVEHDPDVDRLEAARTNVDLDLALRHRPRTVHEDDVANAREDLAEDRPVLLEAQPPLLTQRRA
jgi:hypothetical protein